MTEETKTAYDTTEELVWAYATAKAQLSEIEDKLHDTVTAAAKRYANVWTKYHRGYGYPISMDSMDWTISENGRWVEISWEDRWSYGGHDDGAFDFSVDFLLDESQYAKLEEKLIAAKALAEKERLEKGEKRERKLLKSLREKYGID